MTEKDLSGFARKSEIAEDMKDDEKQCGQNKESVKMVNCSKPRKSGSFVRSWGGWFVGDE